MWKRFGTIYVTNVGSGSYSVSLSFIARSSFKAYNRALRDEQADVAIRCKAQKRDQRKPR